MPPEPPSKPKVKRSKASKGSDGQRFAANAMDLARALGVSARTIKLWKTIDGNPGADGSGRYRIQEWQDWAIKSGKDTSKGSGPITKQEWEIEKIKRQVEAQDLDLKQRKGALVLKSEITRDIHAAVFAFRTEIESIPGKLAPQVVGLSIPEAELRISGALQEALMKLHREEWRTK